MKKTLLLGAALAAVALTGFNSAKAEDTVAVIVKATTSEYWQWVFKGAEDAGKQLGVKVDKLGTPKDDASGQIAVLESAAGSKPAAIVISPTIFEALGDPISAVSDAGIPVIVIDSGAKTDKYAKTDSDARTDTNSGAYSYTRAHSNARTDSNTRAHSDTGADTHSGAHSDSKAY